MVIAHTTFFSLQTIVVSSKTTTAYWHTIFARHFFSCEHKIIFIAIAATTRINSFVFDAAASCWFPSFFFFFKHIIWSSFNGKWCLASTTVAVLTNSRKCFNPVCNCLNFSYIPEWLKKMNSKKPKTDRQKITAWWKSPFKAVMNTILPWLASIPAHFVMSENYKKKNWI